MRRHPLRSDSRAVELTRFYAWQSQESVASMRAPRHELSPATAGLPTTRPDSYLTDLAATPLRSRPHASARDVGATLHSHAGGVTFDDRLVVPHFSTTPLGSSKAPQ
ncbi:hypothetical protein [Rubinisphaera italica]|uniref:hypothetical protein n=1 Tax=Rubinisphaera italica TaxID=2527969 RepID=UPI0013EF15E2|nr:hypothetical protein [Rubinisphaera italica]